MTSEDKSFNDGDELLFHIASLGASQVPLPEKIALQTGEYMTTQLNMMDGIYRGEDDTFWLLDVMSVDPPLINAKLLKSGVDLIGVKTTIDAISRRVLPA